MHPFVSYTNENSRLFLECLQFRVRTPREAIDQFFAASLPDMLAVTSKADGTHSIRWGTHGDESPVASQNLIATVTGLITTDQRPPASSPALVASAAPQSAGQLALF